MALQTINAAMTSTITTLTERVNTVYVTGESLDFVDEYDTALGSLAGIEPAQSENIDFSNTYESNVDTSAIEPAGSGG